jgi:hypothetical protein
MVTILVKAYAGGAHEVPRFGGGRGDANSSIGYLGRSGSGPAEGLGRSSSDMTPPCSKPGGIHQRFRGQVGADSDGADEGAGYSAAGTDGGSKRRPET